MISIEKSKTQKELMAKFDDMARAISENVDKIFQPRIYKTPSTEEFALVITIRFWVDYPRARAFDEVEKEFHTACNGWEALGYSVRVIDE